MGRGRPSTMENIFESITTTQLSLRLIRSGSVFVSLQIQPLTHSCMYPLRKRPIVERKDRIDYVSSLSHVLVLVVVHEQREAHLLQIRQGQGSVPYLSTLQTSWLNFVAQMGLGTVSIAMCE